MKGQGLSSELTIDDENEDYDSECRDEDNNNEPGDEPETENTVTHHRYSDHHDDGSSSLIRNQSEAMTESEQPAGSSEIQRQQKPMEMEKEIPKVNSRIKYRLPHNDEWIHAKVTSRGGKATGKNKYYVNVINDTLENFKQVIPSQCSVN